MKVINTKKSGFTLVEMMVAIAVFSVVMTTAMSALLNVIDANNKARSIKTAINNISFALEGISKDMRMGTDYSCLDNGGCVSTGNAEIKYKSPRGGHAYYKFSGTQIFECLEKGIKICNSDANFSPITSSEVTLTSVKFYVLNTGDSTKQPRMILTVSGTAGPSNKPKLQTDFDLQTSVSQRIRN